MLRGSQDCSALQPPMAASVWPLATPPQRWAAQPSFLFWPYSLAAGLPLLSGIRRYAPHA
ncbi:hypothetical protein SGRA_3333 [Saprospira grandis str. Lewin]|uniref:Uncharacterized protein n=1 Tax=Saprospira grandis (strain Lewin) TaxID=984262 RepID=H6L124_SAPGL|nr:hypothetical protein SGRA_3333 [Saprospira grandis str. Lewin]